MKLSFGALQVNIKNTYLRGGKFYYQRPVPAELRTRYTGATIKKALRTSDPVVAARMVDALNREVEAEWAGLRAAPESSPKALKAHAATFLRSFGLAPGAPDNPPEAVELLHDYIDRKRARYAGGDEHLYREADPADYLTPAEREAGRRLHGAPRDTLSDALAVYLEGSRKRDDARFVAYASRAFATLVEVVGDKDIAACTRADARRYIGACLDKGNKTATIRRRLNVLIAVWNAYRIEKAPGCINPFEKLEIPGEGADSTARVPFTADQLAVVYRECYTTDDDIRWLVAMLIDTGARLAEVAGLPLADIRLDAEVPHIVIQAHPWRPIKKPAKALKAPSRTVPLVGASLWAARRVVESAPEGERMAFPRYTDEKECRATHASNTLRLWLKRIGIGRVPHELRHALKDRLREVECPKDINDALLGHGSKSVGDRYGTGYGLTVKAGWMGKVALSVPAAVAPATP